MLQYKDPLTLAAEILGVDVEAEKTTIQYGYYRMMIRHHPDKNKDDPQANRLAALINEAKDVLLGRETNPTLLKDRDLMAEMMQRPVSDDDALSYEEWLQNRFYNMEQCSIWPC